MTGAPGDRASRTLDQRRHLPCAAVAEIAEGGRDVEPVIPCHQIANPVEIAAEDHIAAAELLVPALPVQEDRDQGSVVQPTGRDEGHRPRLRLQRRPGLPALHRHVDIFPLDAPFGNSVATIDVAKLLIVHDPVSAAVTLLDDVVGEEFVLERRQLMIGRMGTLAHECQGKAEAHQYES